MDNNKKLFNIYLDHVLNRDSHQMTEAQCGTNFGRDSLALQAQLSRAPHDIDNVRAKIINTVEALLLTINKCGLNSPYTPYLFINQQEEDIRKLDNLLSNLLEAILHQLSIKTINNQSYLLDKVDCFIEAALKRGQFNNLDNFATLALEYHNFWPNLLVQRQRFIENHPNHQNQLELKSIFPLQYNLHSDRDNPVSKLIRQGNLKKDPNKQFSLLDLKVQIGTIALRMAIYNLQHPYESQHTAITDLAIATGWPEEKINLNNLYSLLPLIVTTITPPTFQEAWATTLVNWGYNPSKQEFPQESASNAVTLNSDYEKQETKEYIKLPGAYNSPASNFNIEEFIKEYIQITDSNTPPSSFVIKPEPK